MAIAVRVRVPPSAPVRKSKGHGDVRDPFLLLFSCRGAGPPVPCVSCPAREAGDKAKESPRALHCRPPPAYHSPSAGRLDVPTASRPVKAATSLFPCPAPLLFPRTARKAWRSRGHAPAGSPFPAHGEEGRPRKACRVALHAIRPVVSRRKRRFSARFGPGGDLCRCVAASRFVFFQR